MSQGDVTDEKMAAFEKWRAEQIAAVRGPLDGCDENDLDELLERYQSKGWEIVNFMGQPRFLYRRVFRHRIMSRLRFREREYECAAIEDTPRGEEYMISPVDATVVLPTQRWWRTKNRKLIIPHMLGSCYGVSVAPAEVNISTSENCRITASKAVSEFAERTLVHRSLWCLIPFIGRVSLDDLADRWEAEERAVIPLDGEDIAYLLWLTDGSFSSTYLRGWMWKERHDHYRSVVAPLLKWGITAGAAIAGVIFAVLRFTNGSPTP